jgi:hypothetical protein
MYSTMIISRGERWIAYTTYTSRHGEGRSQRPEATKRIVANQPASQPSPAREPGKEHHSRSWRFGPDSEARLHGNLGRSIIAQRNLEEGIQKNASSSIGRSAYACTALQERISIQTRTVHAMRPGRPSCISKPSSRLSTRCIPTGFEMNASSSF